MNKFLKFGAVLAVITMVLTLFLTACSNPPDNPKEEAMTTTLSG